MSRSGSRSRSFCQCFNLYLQANPDKPVLVAGDPERAHEAVVEKDGGVWYHDNLIAAMVSIAIYGDCANLRVGCIITHTHTHAHTHTQNKLAAQLHVEPMKLK